MDQEELAQYKKLILTPVEKLIPSLAIPTIISMMISMIYNLVDAFFVGKLGTSASASIGILMSVQTIFQALGFMCGHGSGSNISVKLGMNDRKSADQIASTGFFTCMLISVLPAILGLIFITPLMKLLGSTATILPYSRRYGFYMLIAGPALAMSCVLNNIMRYEGKAFYAMIGLVSGGVLNMIGDPIFIFGFGMGIDGAGLSTALSQYISMGVLGYMFLSGKTISRISPGNVRPVWIRRIVKNGLPSLIRQTMNSLSVMILNISAAPYGDAAIAAMTITGRIAMFVASVMIGIGQGLQPVSAYNYGAKKYVRVKKAALFTLKCAEVLLCLMAIVIAFFPAPLVRFFRDDDLVVQIGILALRFQCIALAIQPISVLTNMLFQSIGKSRTASITASMRTGIFYIPAMLIMPRIFGITGIQAAPMVADVVTSLVCLPLLVNFMKELPKEDQVTHVDEAYARILEQSGGEEHL